MEVKKKLERLISTCKKITFRGHCADPVLILMGMKSHRLNIDPPTQGRINFDVFTFLVINYLVPIIINNNVSYPVAVHY